MKIIELPKFTDPRGNLSFAEQNNHIPFEIKRTYWIYDVPGGECRGGHAFYQNEEFIVALSGAFDVIVDDGKEKKTFALNRSYYGLYIPKGHYSEDGSKEKALTHSLYFLLHDEPNPEMTSFVFRETLMTHLLLWGNAYAQIIRNGKGDVIALYPLMPNKMEVNRDENGVLYYSYSRDKDEANAKDSQSSVKLSTHDVLHIPGLGFDGLVGYSPIAMAKNAIGMAMACEEFGAKFFANGASPSGVLEHPGILKDPAKVRDSWNTAYGGSSNSHKVAVLEEGMKYTPISISPNEAQFLETRKFQINEIARIFRVPPHMVGDLVKNVQEQVLANAKVDSANLL